jgi:hypothetical protein
MKIKKTVTTDVIAANRANAKRSTGPRRPEIVMVNALKHGLLSRNLSFQTEKEKQDFDELVHDLLAEYQPAGASEEILVEEFAIACWQLGRLYGLGDQELQRRRKTNEWVLDHLASAEHRGEAPILEDLEGPGSRHLGLDCESLVVRTGSATLKTEKEILNDKSSKTGTWHIEAKLAPSLDLMARYQAMWERKFYRALGALRQIVRDRTQADGCSTVTISTGGSLNGKNA